MFPIHEYTVDRAKGVAKIGSVNIARTYVKGAKDEDGVMQVQYRTAQIHKGEIHYFDEGGIAIPHDEVPEWLLADLAKNPLRRGNEKIEQVIKFCPYCPAPDNVMASEAYEPHLVKHLIAAGIQPVAATKPEPKAKAKKAA